MPAKCDRCGATTTTAESFFKERLSFRRKIQTLCPNCWNKKTSTVYRRILIFQLSPGPLGILLLSFARDSGFGWLLLNLFLFQLFLILSIIPHELGHALAAKCLGWRVFRIFLGYGPSVAKRRLFGFETELRAIPVGGLVLTTPRTFEHLFRKYLAIILAGPCVNLALAAAALPLLEPDQFWSLAGIDTHLLPLRMFLFSNFAVLLESLWPHLIATPLGKIPSDGKQLLQILRRKKEHAAEIHALCFALEGAECHQQGKYAEAESWFQRGLKLYPQNVHLLTWRGNNLLDLRRFSDARESYLKILPLVENQAISRAILLNNIAFTNTLIGGTNLLEEADRFSNEAMTVLSWMPPVRGTRGTVLAVLGKTDEAVPLLSEAMQANDTAHGKALNACLLAIVEARRGKLPASRTYLDEARKLDPNCFLLNRAEESLATAERSVLRS